MIESGGIPATGEAAIFCAAHGISAHRDSHIAAEQVALQISDALPDPRQANLLLIFADQSHRDNFAEITAHLQKTLQPEVTLGVLAEAVSGGETELDDGPGISALALRMPDVRLTPFTYDQISAGNIHNTPHKLAEIMGLDSSSKAVLIFADPFSTPVTDLLTDIRLASATIPSLPPLPVTGGMASAGRKSGENRLVLNDQLFLAGAVGVTISGSVDLSFIVSQGCKPIGRPLIVTAARRTLLQQLAGRPALEVIREMMNEVSDEERSLASRGLLLGKVIDEYKDHFGRGDFLVRGIIGADPKAGILAIEEPLRVGQTVQLHVRDATTADEDLKLLLDGQKIHDQPAAALLVSCNGRGKKLFDQPHHDVLAVKQALGDIPLAGFFAAGEIGPIGNRSFLHGHTASLVLFRSPIQQ